MAQLLLMQEILQKSIDQQRVFRDRRNVFDNYSEDQFRERFRYSKNGVMKLVEFLRVDLEKSSNRSCDFPSEFEILIALRFYASGSMQLVLADTFNDTVPKSSVSRIIEKISTALANHADSVIKFPSTNEEISAVKNGFFNLYGMPGVLGCVDGTHIPIIPSAKFKPPEEFYGRKGCTINCQFICDDKFRFTNAVVAFPGSAHDMRIWKDSVIGQKFIMGSMNGKGHLLGDSGYTLRKVC